MSVLFLIFLDLIYPKWIRSVQNQNIGQRLGSARAAGIFLCIQISSKKSISVNEIIPNYYFNI
jgi:hypothetical protein